MNSKFSGLNAFRCFAALGVFVHHVEEFKKHSGFESLGKFKGINALGGISVTAFFVLSGFLLSFLLMKEKNNTGTIHLPYFYQRRLLRIWPLYFFTLLLYKVVLINMPLDIIASLKQGATLNDYDAVSGIVLSPLAEWLMLIFFMPHVLLSLGVVFNPAHVWSIGVEEFFYLFWPIIILKSRNYLKSFLSVISVYLLLLFTAFIILLWSTKSFEPGTMPSIIAKFSFSFLYFERISCMAIGAIAAWIVLNEKNKMLEFIKSPLAIFVSISILSILIFKGFSLPFLSNEIYSVLFSIIIINIIQPKYKAFEFFENKILRFLGDISYGIYMFNPFTILITVEILNKFCTDKKSFIICYPLFYFVAFSFTIFMSFLSYKFLEKPFLRLKKYHQPQ